MSYTFNEKSEEKIEANRKAIQSHEAAWLARQSVDTGRQYLKGVEKKRGIEAAENLKEAANECRAANHAERKAKVRAALSSK